MADWKLRIAVMTFFLIALTGAARLPISAAAQESAKPSKPTLIGLDAATVVARIGEPDQKDELADSDEAYWIYKAKPGVLTVHFQNHVVISYSPEDFPLEQIWRNGEKKR